MSSELVINPVHHSSCRPSGLGWIAQLGETQMNSRELSSLMETVAAGVIQLTEEVSESRARILDTTAVSPALHHWFCDSKDQCFPCDNRFGVAVSQRNGTA